MIRLEIDDELTFEDYDPNMGYYQTYLILEFATWLSENTPTALVTFLSFKQYVVFRNEQDATLAKLTWNLESRYDYVESTYD